MKVLVTSCNRHDLLVETIQSLMKDQPEKLEITIHEDHADAMPFGLEGIEPLRFVATGGIGQHASIAKFIKSPKPNFYLHTEDDWKFDNTFPWIKQSLEIMAEDETIVKVLGSVGTPHPCTFDRQTKSGVRYGVHEVWTDPWKKNMWHGFSWNPGVTRVPPLKQLLPFPPLEQDVATDIHNLGLKVALLEQRFCTHIGRGRSTHAN